MSEIERANCTGLVPFDWVPEHFWWTRTDPSQRDLAAYKKLLLGDPCAYCGAPSTVLDHVQARKRGGANDWTNLVGLCALCNTRKSARSILGFLGGELHRPVLREAQAIASAWFAI